MGAAGMAAGCSIARCPNTGSSRVAKHRWATELGIEEPEVGSIEVGEALKQAEVWIDQWDKPVWRGGAGHLLRSIPQQKAEKRSGSRKPGQGSSS